MAASRTLVETEACPEELLRGEAPWNLEELIVECVLGEGRLSSVALCRCGRTDIRLALKSYHKQILTMQDCKQVAKEIAIHSCQQHPNILGFYAAFEDLDSIHLVQEYAPGGDLYRELAAAGGNLSERVVARRVMRPLLSALACLHEQGIVHRDVKPENLLLAADRTIRLADFGVALDTNQDTSTARVGTLDYFAPEVLLNEISPTEQSAACGVEVDIWAAGVLGYELLLGGPPFEADTKKQTFDKILYEDPFLPSVWSTAARDFISQVLTKDPSERPSAVRLLEHEWLR